MTDETTDVNLSFRPDFIPTLHDIHKSFDVIRIGKFKGIKGEFKTRMALFTNFVLGNKCVIFKGNRSTGKSLVLETVSTYCRNPLEIDQASDKADYRDTDLNKSSHFIIPEINKVSETFIECLKDFGEGKNATYKVLDEWKRPIKFCIKVKPFVTSMADENKSNRLGDELVSRLTVLHTNSSIEQNQEVIKDKLLRAQNPFKDLGLTPEKIQEFQRYVKTLPNIDKTNFIYLPGKSIIASIPPFFTDSRRDTDKYLDNTYGITLFHYYDRLKVTKNGKSYLLVTPLDAWYNHIIFKDILIKSAMKCSDTERLIVDILRKHSMENRGNPYMKVKEIHSSIMKNGLTPSMTTVVSHIGDLVKNGYVVKNDDSRPSTYEASDYFKEFEGSVDWKRVVEECKKVVREIVPEKAEEYIKLYCSDEIIGEQPFTGEKVNILTYKEKEVVIHKEKNSLSDFIHYAEDREKISNNSEEESLDDEQSVPKQKISDRNLKVYFDNFCNDEGLVNGIDLENTFGVKAIDRWVEEFILSEPKPGRYQML